MDGCLGGVLFERTVALLAQIQTVPVRECALPNDIIFKYHMRLQRKTLNIPRDAQILDAQMQAGKLMMWACVDSKKGDDLEPRTFEFFGTGQKLPADETLRYICTLQHDEFVWHLCEVLDPAPA